MKSCEEQKIHYEDLIKITEMTLEYAQDAVSKLKARKARSVLDGALADSIVQQIGHFLELTRKVLSQTIRRVINGESVPAPEKVVSIFEVHTDIIEKGGRETTFGHKVYLSSGKSGLVLDCEVLKGNPPDHTLAKLLLARHKDCYGEAPEKIALDGGFASIKARDILKEEVKEVAFGKTNGMAVESLTSSSKIFKALRYFRAGIEAAISALKRRYGFTRVLAKGWEAFKNSLRCAVCVFNLTLLARHQLQRA